MIANNLMKIKFNKRPAPVLVEHRPIYKIGQIALILYISSRAYKSSLTRLHLFNWVLKDKNRQNDFLNAGENGNFRISAWGFDPALTIAIRFAIAEKLLFEEGSGYKLTDLGIRFAKKIMLDDSIFSEEKKILFLIKKSITEGMVESVTKSWTSL